MTYQEKLAWIAEYNPRVQATSEEVGQAISQAIQCSIIGWFLTDEEIADELIRKIQALKARNNAPSRSGSVGTKKRRET